MQWHRIIDGVGAIEVVALRTAEIESVEYDSRAVRPGSLFVAMRGGTTDGNRYVSSALEAGAVALVTDSRESFTVASGRGLAVALVEDGRRALAELSANFFHHPERSLKLTAVTGTNGKTTTAFLIEGLLRAYRRRCILLGTIEAHIVGEIRSSPRTTPESRDVLEVFAEGVQRGATEAVMEMSSHALAQERVWGLPVDVAIFTNLTQDHLDYHHTMESYAQAKARLFRGVGTSPPRVAILNADDPSCDGMRDAASECETVWTYSVRHEADSIAKEADFVASQIELRAGETRFLLSTPGGTVAIRSGLSGRVNVYNLTAAVAAAMARGVPLEVCRVASAALLPVPGRFETVPNGLGLSVVVDYAHTDDALRSLIALARDLVGSGRVITVFGCGGDRDRAKRPKMGRVAAEGSDLVIVTSDNPRSEDQAAIAREILAGMESSSTEVELELDRRAAIGRAIGRAVPGDIVLLAGKGHEKVQSIDGIELDFDDVEEASLCLRR